MSINRERERCDNQNEQMKALFFRFGVSPEKLEHYISKSEQELERYLNQMLSRPQPYVWLNIEREYIVEEAICSIILC